MDKELYEAIMEVTGTDAWKRVQAELANDLINYRDRLERVDDLTNLGRLQGQIIAVDSFVRMRELAKNVV